EIDARLAALIEEKQRIATVPLPAPTRLFEIGIEEIGDGEDLAIGTAHAAPVSTLEPAPMFDHDLLTDDGAAGPELAVAPVEPSVAPPARPAARAERPVKPQFELDAEPVEVAVQRFEPRARPMAVPARPVQLEPELALEAEPLEISAEAFELEAEPMLVEVEPLEVEP